MDFFADNQLKAVLRKLTDNKFKPTSNVALWKQMTRQIFRNYPAIQINNWIEEISQEAYDEEWFEKKYKKEEFKRKFVDFKETLKTKGIKVKGGARKIIDANLKISDVAKSFGIKVRGKKCKCPFHNDTKPSLSLDDNKNIFNCFGCSASGDIVEFYRLLKEREKNDNKKRSKS